MKYLCVGYYDQDRMDTLSKAEADAVMGECPPCMEELYNSGKVRLMAGVDAEAKVMRRVNGEVKITDSPAGERHRMIGCAFLVEAWDMADAIRVASLHPTTRIRAGEQLGWRLGISPVHYFEEREGRG
jgi:hypothetical protein